MDLYKAQHGPINTTKRILLVCCRVYIQSYKAAVRLKEDMSVSSSTGEPDTAGVYLPEVLLPQWAGLELTLIPDLL